MMHAIIFSIVDLITVVVAFAACIMAGHDDTATGREEIEQ